MARWFRSVAVLVFAAAAGCWVAQDPAVRPLWGLVGTWRFESYEDRDAAGTTVRPYGEAPAGLLIYDATGHMAV